MARIAGVIAGLVALGAVWVMGASGNDGAAPRAGARTIPSTTAPARAPAMAAGATPTTVDDRGFSALENGSGMKMDMAERPIATLPKGVQVELRRQLALTQDVVRRLATVQDALAAGYRRAGPFSPGLGTHYTLQNGQGLNPDGVMDDKDILAPLSVIYAGSAPDSPLVGIMYYSISPKLPEGFAGPNDMWHVHKRICLTRNPDGSIDAPLGADRDTTEAACAKIGGSLLKQTQWMLHVWTVPAYSSPQGVFSPLNSSITCSDGTYYERPPSRWMDNPLDACKNAA